MSVASLVSDMPEAEYHAHPALSSSGAKKLLPPSCPAIYHWERDHGQAPRQEFDFGHAAHAVVLGVGAPVAVADFSDYRTKAAQAWRDEVRAAGRVPLLVGEAMQVTDMATALREHPIASALLDGSRGSAEQSIFWGDARHGIARRARLDWLPDSDGGRLILADFKTTISAEPGAIRKAVANYGYHCQASWYIDAVRALGVAEDVAFVFIFQAKTPPYLVTVAELDAQALRVGAALNDRAMSVFADCTANDTWPGYSDDVELVSLPPWATYVEELSV